MGMTLREKVALAIADCANFDERLAPSMADAAIRAVVEHLEGEDSRKGFEAAVMLWYGDNDPEYPYGQSCIDKMRTCLRAAVGES